MSPQPSSRALLSAVLLVMAAATTTEATTTTTTFSTTLLNAPDSSCPSSCNCYGTKVDCSSLGLTTVPQGVPASTTHLYLRSNNINSISVVDFRGLNALQELDLSANKIRTIPYGVFDLPNLEILRLPFNSIDSFATGSGPFIGLNNLKQLILTGNAITTVSGDVFTGLSTLENLYLDNNDINTITSSAFTGLSSLQLLDLSTNAIDAVSTGTFYGLPVLQTLVLRDNNIGTISSGSLSGLNTVRTLDLSSNSISAIASGTFAFSSNLTDLDLNNNVIGSLRANTFVGASSLKTLRLRDNAISTIERDAFAGMLRMDSVDLQNNALTSIDEGDFLGLRGATTLNLADNNIARLPEWGFRGAEDLVSIDLQNNKIGSIHIDAFRGLPALKTLDLRDNALNATIGGMTPGFQSIETLKLSGNNINSIPRDAFQGLNIKTLDLSRNNISSLLPGAFNGLRNLESLELSQNKIESVPGMMFQQISSLRTLRLQNNPWNCNCKLLELVRWMQVCLFVCLFFYLFLDRRGQCGTALELVTSVDLGNRNEIVCAPAGPFTGLALMPVPNVSQELEMSCADRTSPRPRPLPQSPTPRGTRGTTVRIPIATTTDEDRTTPLPPPPPQGLTNTTVIVISVVVSLAVVTVAACVLGFLWAKKKRRMAFEVGRGGTTGHDNHYMDLTGFPASQPPPVPIRSQFQKYELDKKDLELKEEIGRGAFGVVHLATRHRNDNGFPTEETVVVKTVHAYAGAQERVTFVREIETTLDLGKHPNLLGLVGCCTTSHPAYMVTEYMPYGDLKEFLLKCRKADERLKDSTYDLDELNKYQIARQIANGMIFISQAGYVHGDLAARNVLVGENLVVKIADFGLATDVYERGYQRQDAEQKIPVRWMAPERLLREGRYTSKSDVWSFGVVLYEIATLGNVPYPGLDRQLMEELRSGYREPQPENCPQEMYSLMLQCWQWEEDDRPEFQQLYTELDRLMEGCCDVTYLEPFDDPAGAEAAGASPQAVSEEAINDFSAHPKTNPKMQSVNPRRSRSLWKLLRDSLSNNGAGSSTRQEKQTPEIH
ncbi:uncharacterized protein LOC144882711 [Branchiostoma floridae x Branchiostoma japonicum]